jgi:alkyl sulfatase BDS1-like metallo-beta-lactamase superfamily hydrolase
VFGLGEWGARWAFGEPDAEELDPDLLVWWMHTRLDTSQLPGRRHVLHLRFSDEKKRFWIVIEDGVPSVCLVDPGYEVDVMISSSLQTMYSVWLGRISLERALRTGEVEFTGPKELTRRMPDVLRLSPVAEMVGTATATTTSDARLNT